MTLNGDETMMGSGLKILNKTLIGYEFYKVSYFMYLEFQKIFDYEVIKTLEWILYLPLFMFGMGTTFIIMATESIVLIYESFYFHKHKDKDISKQLYLCIKICAVLSVLSNIEIFFYWLCNL